MEFSDKIFEGYRMAHYLFLFSHPLMRCRVPQEYILMLVIVLPVRHWKSISQQKLPVRTIYPEMVAEIFPHFEGDDLREVAKNNLWFL